jgi:hypothetical protein
MRGFFVSSISMRLREAFGATLRWLTNKARMYCMFVCVCVVVFFGLRAPVFLLYFEPQVRAPRFFSLFWFFFFTRERISSS